MRRGLAWMLALTFLVGGVAACSDDDDGGDEATSEESGGDDTAADEGGDSGGNEAIQEYCDAVQEFVAKSEELVDDPTNADLQAEVTELSTALTDQATDLAAEAPSFTPEDAEEFAACQADFAG